MKKILMFRVRENFWDSYQDTNQLRRKGIMRIWLIMQESAHFREPQNKTIWDSIARKMSWWHVRPQFWILWTLTWTLTQHASTSLKYLWLKVSFTRQTCILKAQYRTRDVSTCWKSILSSLCSWVCKTISSSTQTSIWLLAQLLVLQESNATSIQFGQQNLSSLQDYSILISAILKKD